MKNGVRAAYGRKSVEVMKCTLETTLDMARFFSYKFGINAPVEEFEEMFRESARPPNMVMRVAAGIVVDNSITVKAVSMSENPPRRLLEVSKEKENPDVLALFAFPAYVLCNPRSEGTPTAGATSLLEDVGLYEAVERFTRAALREYEEV